VGGCENVKYKSSQPEYTALRSFENSGPRNDAQLLEETAERLLQAIVLRRARLSEHFLDYGRGAVFAPVVSRRRAREWRLVTLAAEGERVRGNAMYPGSSPRGSGDRSAARHLAFASSLKK